MNENFRRGDGRARLSVASAAERVYRKAMSKFIGGSAYAMAHDIGDGYVSVTDRTFKAFSAADIRQLTFEIDRYLRELRGSQSATDEMELVRKRSRTIGRLNTASMIIRVFRQKHRIA